MVVRVKVRSFDETPPNEFVAGDGISCTAGTILSRNIISGPDRPLLLSAHELGPGAAIRWAKPSQGHVFHVWKGAIELDGARIDAGGTVVGEHGSTGEIRAEQSGVILLQFRVQSGVGPMPTRNGGHVHTVGEDGVFTCKFEDRESEHTMLVDSTCRYCESWLHRSSFGPTAFDIPPHYHTEAEIIFTLSGEMSVGSRKLLPGTALAIDARTTYAFSVGSVGLSFLNYRPTSPCVVIMSRGKPQNEPISERADYLEHEGLIGPIMAAVRAGAA